MTRNGTIWVARRGVRGLATTASAQRHSSGIGSAHSGLDAAGRRAMGLQAQTRSTTPATQTAGAAACRRPVVQLTLDDAVKLALDRNLDIAVQRLNPQINDIAIASIARSTTRA